MTTFTRCVKQTVLAVVTITMAIAGVSAQTAPPQTGGQAQQWPAGPRGPRNPAAPDANLNLQAVQDALNGWALVEAEKDLGLTDTQYPDFVARMRRIQNMRQRQTMERNRLMRELNAMAFSSQRPDDAALTEKLKTFDQHNEKAAQDIKQLTQELDGILTPFQRVRFRVFEERMERRKLDMLTRARAARGGGSPEPAQPPQKGRGGQ